MALTNIKESLLKTELYKRITITEDDFDSLEYLIKGYLQVDAYCPDCKKLSTFHSRVRDNLIRGAAPYPNRPEALEKKLNNLIEESSIFQRVLECTRDINHLMIFDFIIKESEESHSLIKIGQYPSLSDLKKADRKKYDKLISKLISKEKANEYNYSIILHANGFSVGAFVYLRRVYESIIRMTFDNNSKNIGMNKSEFDKKRMDEKIECLQEYLPDFIVKNKIIYGVLSKGVHELNKEKCSELYKTLIGSLEIILDDIHNKREEKKKREKLKKELNLANMNINE